MTMFISFVQFAYRASGELQQPDSDEATARLPRHTDRGRRKQDGGFNDISQVGRAR